MQDLLIGLCYRSDNAAIVGQENELQLRQLLQEVCGSHVLIMGDFNYPDVDWSSGPVAASVHSSADEFVHTLEDCFLAQHVLVPTRGDSILDLILTRDPDLVSDVKTLHPLGNNDHNMILFTVHLECDIAVDKKKLEITNMETTILFVRYYQTLTGTAS